MMEYLKNFLIIGIASLVSIGVVYLCFDIWDKKLKDHDYFFVGLILDTDTSRTKIIKKVDFENRKQTVIWDTFELKISSDLKNRSHYPETNIDLNEYIIDTIKQTDAGLVLKYRPKKVKIQLDKPIE